VKFAAGDHVTLNGDLVCDVVTLFAEPFEATYVPQIVSKFEKGETAIVVSLSSFDGKCVYVIGPNGAGWTFGAFLKLVK
jgi:hypothetical protein